MATQMFLRSTNVIAAPEVVRSDATATATTKPLIAGTRGGLATGTGTTATVTGPTNGVQLTLAGTPFEWLSVDLDADFTISGSITFNFWMNEANMTNNAGAQCIIDVIDTQGNVRTEIINSERGVEMGTTLAAQNWSATPTSTAVTRGERLRVRVFFNDAGGTMASGGSVNMSYDGPTAGASGDSYVTFTENLTFNTLAPSNVNGNAIYLKATSSDINPNSITAYVADFVNSGANTADLVTNTAAGWLTPIQMTVTAGGTAAEWYTPPLAAATINQIAIQVTSLITSNNASKAQGKLEVALVDNDGTNPTILTSFSDGVPLTTGALGVGYNTFIPNTNIVAGQRLRIRPFIDDYIFSGPMVTGHTVTLQDFDDNQSVLITDQTLKLLRSGSGQALAMIRGSGQAFGQAQARIKTFGVTNFGQAQADIKQVYTDKTGQANAQIIILGGGLGQANAVINGTYTSVIDSFTRSVTDGLGSADTGGAYTLITGTAANADVNGSEATIQTSSQSYVVNLKEVLVPVNISVRFRFKESIIPDITGTQFRFDLGLGSEDINVGLGYLVLVTYSIVTGKITIQLGSNGGAGSTTPATDLTPIADTWYVVETTQTRTSNGQIRRRAKIYEEGTTPTNYGFLTDSTYTVPGHLRFSVQNKVSDNLPLISIDAIEIIEAAWTESGQAQARIKATSNGLGQAQAKIKAFGVPASGQAMAYVGTVATGVTVGGSTRTNNGESVSTLSATTMPTHDTGDQLVVITGWKANPARTHTVPSGWTQISEVEDSTHDGYAQYKIVVLTKRALSNAETFSMSLSGTTQWSEVHVWTLSISDASTPATTDDTTFDASYDVPALTFAPATPSQVLTVGMTSRGDRGLTALTGQEVTLGGNNQAWAPYFAMMSQWDTFLGTNPAATSGSITNGSDKSLAVRVGFGPAANVVVKESYSAGGDATVDTSHTFTAPSGIVSGDFLLAGIAWNGSPGTITKPTGWNDVPSGSAVGQANPKVNMYYKVAGGSEPSTYVWTTTGSIYSAGIIVRYSNVDPTTPFDFTSVGTDGVAAITFDLTGGTTVTANARVFAFAAANSSADRITEDNNLIEIARTFGTNIKNSMMVDATQAVAGATGVKNFDLNSSIAWAGVVGALRPTSAGVTETRVYSQAQADIKAVGQGFGQSQSDIKAVGRGFAQAQSDIKATSSGFGQSQADIKQVYTDKTGQSQADIKQTGRGFGQAQSDIKQVGRGLGQAQSDIKQVYTDKTGQANAWIENTYNGLGQAQSDIKAKGYGLSQSQADIKATARGLGQSQADIKDTDQGLGQSQADIKQIYFGLGQAQSDVKAVGYGSGQAQADIKQVGRGLGQAQSDIKATSFALGQTQADIKTTNIGAGQANASVTKTSFVMGQAQADIKAISWGLGQSQADIKATYIDTGQAQATIKNTYIGTGQAQATIRGTAFGQAQADIKQAYFGLGQAQSDIKNTYRGLGQAQGDIKQAGSGLGQAQGDIKQTYFALGQAQTQIKNTYIGTGQAQAWIQQTYFGLGQAQADIQNTYIGTGQAQGTIIKTIYAYSQAQALIYISQLAHPDADISVTGWIRTVI